MQLSTSMTVTQFDHGYWYANELKEFAEKIGIPAANKLRKDELERAIKLFLETGKITNPTKRSLAKSGRKDVERGLRLDLPVVLYTNDQETKDFLERESQKLAPGLKRKSGSRYRLNRWREDQLVKGVRLTYAALVKEYVRLNQTIEPFVHIPHGRYVNFVADFLAAEKGATRAQAIKAWKKLKTVDVPKDYCSWAKYQSAKSK
ncbi:MAG: SAP domain-containing protein [Pyrinomonadaceae bacterium]